MMLHLTGNHAACFIPRIALASSTQIIPWRSPSTILTNSFRKGASTSSTSRPTGPVKVIAFENVNSHRYGY